MTDKSHNGTSWDIILEGWGERLKAFRIAKHYRQKDFCNICGLSQAGLSDIEHGRRGISDKILYNLCEYFPDFDANYILTGKKKLLKTAVTEGVENF